MRRLALAAFAVLAAACATDPCQELGDRICRCPPAGVTTDTCKTQVKNAAGSDSGGWSKCSALLDTCNGPDGVDFCEWITTEAGKTACGLAY